METIREHSHEANHGSPSFSPGDYFLYADLGDAEGSTLYGTISSIEREDGNHWFTVREYWEECPPSGEEDERSLVPASHEALIKLTAEEFACARQLGWPNIAQTIIEECEAQAEWLALRGFDGFALLDDGTLCEEDAVQTSVFWRQRAQALRQNINLTLSPSGGKR